MNAPHADDYCPLDDETSQIQIEAILDRTRDLNGCVLDIGCGDGRLAIPLARAGRTVLAIDSDQRALDALHESLRTEDDDTRSRVTLLRADASSLTGAALRAKAPSPIAMAVCVGHTFMLLHDPLDALALMRALGDALEPGAPLLIDDFPHDLWFDVSEGNWQSGIAEMQTDDESEPELWQMVWKPGDPVIALRRGDEVDPDSIEILPTDRLHRLYSMGELRLLCACSGFDEPERAAEDALIVMSRRPRSAR
jgi:SAM-dependent methyltransferase